MTIDEKANDARRMYEARLITRGEIKYILDHLDNLAVLEALEKPIYIPPPIIT